MPEPADRPNVLILHADQHRFDCLGAYGNPDVRTPNIDRLAQDGVTYLNAFCPYPVCTPSRYSLLTGAWVHEHRGASNHSTPLPDYPALPRVMKAAGYRTAAVGKMHFTPTYLDVGFERMALCEQHGPGRWDDDYHRYLQDRGLCDYNDVEDQVDAFRKEAPPQYWQSAGAMRANLPKEHYSTAWIADRALEEIENWPPQGNLLMVGFVKPHHPLDPPAPWDAMYDPNEIELLPGWTESVPPHDLANSRGFYPSEALTEESVRRSTAFYYGLISQVDREIGRIVDALRRRGIYDDTLVVYTSDHGDYMGYHHMLGKNNWQYDPLMKVPLVVKYPSNYQAPHTGADTLRETLATNLDVAPTILAAANCPAPSTMHGRDLAWDDEGRPVVFSEMRLGGEHGSRMQLMARTHTRKLLWTGQVDSSMLFDLEEDPLEMQNRIADPAYAEDKERLVREILDWRGSIEPTATWIDENAPIVDAPNTRRGNHGHRDAIQHYYAERMAALRSELRA